jgi:Ran GTPase-activating protein (RanGAP) involved in mRNA processing and transport
VQFTRRTNNLTTMMHNNNNEYYNISIATAVGNRVEEIYDGILGVGFVVMILLALSNLFIITMNKFVDYYSRQIDRIVMDESDYSESESEFSEDDDDDDSTESDYSEYSDEDEIECSDDDDDDDDDSDCHHHHHHDDIELTEYIPPRRSQRLAENRARCNSPLLVVRRLTFEK